MINLLIDHGAEVDFESGIEFLTPLYYAAGEGHGEAAALLIDRGADVNHRHDFTLTSGDMELLRMYGDLPLHFAAYYNKTASVRLLLDQGADINIKGRGGNTALHIAALNGLGFSSS